MYNFLLLTGHCNIISHRISLKTFGKLNESERLIQEVNNIKYLQLLRTIVHNEIKHIDPELREEGNNPQEFRK